MIIPPAQVQTLYNQGGCDLLAVYAVRDIQSGDTLDLTTTGISPPFTFIRYAIVLSFTANRSAIAAASGTVVTMPAGLPANSTAYLFIGGC